MVWGIGLNYAFNNPIIIEICTVTGPRMLLWVWFYFKVKWRFCGLFFFCRENSLQSSSYFVGCPYRIWRTMSMTFCTLVDLLPCWQDCAYAFPSFFKPKLYGHWLWCHEPCYFKGSKVKVTGSLCGFSSFSWGWYMYLLWLLFVSGLASYYNIMVMEILLAL